MSRPLLILRPEPGASRTVRAAATLRLDAIAVPLFAVEPLHWFPPDPVRFDAVMFTSANAVRAAGNGLARYGALPVYAVGTATAEAARQSGFSHVREGPGDAAGLTAMLEGDGVLRVLHFCGAHRRESAAPGLMIERTTVYESATIDRPEGLDDALEQAPLALLHSPRAAERFAALVDALGRSRAAIPVAAISPAAVAAAGPGWARTEAAATPDDAALLALAARLCDR
jgi:uroporphyrinogen-III synthase